MQNQLVEAQLTRRVRESKPWWLMLIVAVSSWTAFGQSFTGSVLGTVTDSSGAVAAGVAVTATNSETGEKRKAITNAVGQYTLTAMPPGQYRLDVEVNGFKHWQREEIRVDILEGVRIDIILEPGSISETIKVTAESPLLETDNSAIGAVVDNKKIVDLPLNGRNPMALVELTPGVVPGSQNQFGGQPVLQNVYAQGTFTVNSGIQSQTESLVDGVPNNVFLWNSPAFVPSVEAVSEFRVQTNNFSAEFGHSGGGIVNLATRSGTNALHVVVFEFFGNDHLDANNFFNNRSGQPKPPFTYNQFGSSVGGPVVLPHYNGRNHTFFFFNYEGFRRRAGQTVLTTVPTALQRGGDFSQTKNAAGQAINIFDPLTVQATPGVGSGNQRQAFPGNQVPANRFDTAAAALVKLWGLPDLPGTGPAQLTNFVSNPILHDTQDQWMARVDQAWNERQHTFVRYSFMRQLPGQTDVYGTVPGARPVNPFEFNTALLIRSYSLALDHTWVPSPSMLFEFRYGFTRQKQFRDPASLGVDLTSVGFAASYNNAVQIRTFPTLGPSGFDSVGEGGNVYFRRGDNVHSAQASMTRNQGRHTIKSGFEVRGFLFNDTRAPAASGTFGFNPAFTQQDPLQTSATGGNSFASYLLGLAASGSTQYFPAVSLNQNYYGVYLQDDIRLTSNLTMNLGVRWDVETPKTERYNRLSSFEPLAVSPLAQATGLPVRGALVFEGLNRSRSQWSTEWHNVAPRFGVAWRLSPRLVLRGGYGIFYHQTVGQGGLVGNGNDGFATTNSMVTSPDGGIHTGNRLSNPFPSGMPQPTGASLGPLTGLGLSLSPWNSSFRTAYSQHYNFGVQREFSRGFLLEAAYVGSHSVALPMSVPLNQMPVQYLSLGSALLSSAPNPFYGLINTGSLLPPNVARNLLLRPYPQYANVSFFTPIGQATYNSLQMKLQQRFRAGLGVQAAYTFAKALTDSGGGAGGAIGGFNTPSLQNYYDLRSEKAISPVDVTHRLVASFQYELPFGKGKRFGAKGGAVANVLIGGWQLNGIGTMQSGQPLIVTTQVNQINAFTGSSRPNVSASPTLPADQRTLNGWFNTKVFSQPAAYTLGNGPRTLPSTRGPGLQNFDLSLFKNNTFHEHYNLQLRFEAFNALNRANFYNPGAVFGTAQFGVISATGPARVLQIASKLYF